MTISPSCATEENPPACCRQQSVTIPPEDGAKLAQELHYGSPKHRDAYARLRNSNEGMNGFVKDTAYEGLGEPGRRRVRGMAAQTVLAAFMLAAANIRTYQIALAQAEAEGTVRRRPRRKKTLVPTVCTMPITGWAGVT